MGRGKDKSIDISTVYGRMKYFRKIVLNNMTQEDFGHKIGLSKGNISNIEIGRVAITDRVINDICSCEEFNINREWLLTGNGNPQNELLEEDEYSKAAASIVAENDSFGMEIVKTYFSLDAASKAALKNFIIQLASNIKQKENDEI